MRVDLGLAEDELGVVADPLVALEDLREVGLLALGPERGGIGLSSSVMSLFVILMQTGMWLGYVSFGYIADAIGRKKTYVAFVLAASLLLPLYGFLKAPALLLVLGPLVAFFGTGYYSGFGAVIAELYPTSVRATAAGVCYKIGRAHV